MSTMDSQDIADLLNEALISDPVAIEAMIQNGVPVNETLADHPTIQVRCEPPGGTPKLRLIGLLNGIIGRCEPNNLLVATFDEEPIRLTGFSVVTWEQFNKASNHGS